jgi:hypothetical protein
MKKIFKPVFLLAFSLVALTSCVKEDEFDIPKIIPVIFSEDFNDIDFNQTFDYVGWTNFAEAGSILWTERDFNNDGYIQFNSYQGQASNIGWAITPAIDMDQSTGEILSFKSASNFVDNNDNKLEVFISEDYDGTNVLAATWTKLDAVVANKDSNPVASYTYVASGPIDVSSYNGTVHIAFKVTGNGTNLDGLFQVDKVKVYSLN